MACDPYHLGMVFRTEKQGECLIFRVLICDGVYLGNEGAGAVDKGRSACGEPFLQFFFYPVGADDEYTALYVFGEKKRFCLIFFDSAHSEFVKLFRYDGVVDKKTESIDLLSLVLVDDILNGAYGAFNAEAKARVFCNGYLHSLFFRFLIGVKSADPFRDDFGCGVHF